MAALKLHRTDTGVGATFPDELLAQLNVREGDVLELRQTPDGMLLKAADAPRDEVMRVARRVMAENEEVLRALAK